MSQHAKAVLAYPGKYHPAYNKESGYEIAGMVWFQGWNDLVEFRAAQEATADLAEFKGNVKALQTVPFWPDDVAPLEVKMRECGKQADAELKLKQKDEPDNPDYRDKKGWL